MLEEFGGDIPTGRIAYKKQIGNDVLEGLSIKDKIIGQSLLGENDFISRASEKFLKEAKDRERPAVGIIHSYAARDDILRVAAEALGTALDDISRYVIISK